MSETDANYKRTRIFFWCAAISLGVADAWASRNAMNPDGVSYLDMGNAFFHHNWHMAINAYWSPLYPWIEGFFLWVLKPSARWEFPIVHLVNLLVYISALASFDFFLRAFIRFHQTSIQLLPSPSLSTPSPSPASGREGTGERWVREGDERTRARAAISEQMVESAESSAGFREWVWYVLGYSLFIWTSLVMIGAGSNVSPDLCVAALVYLAFGFLLQMRNRTCSRGKFLLFGAVLGFGYLAKAVMFPLAFVFLAVALFSLSSLRKAAPRVLLSALVFGAIASPWLVLLSRAKGRLTFGESGRVNYEYHINGYALWFPTARALKHPVSMLISSPPTYEFAAPVGGTYPLWYDTSYWHEGLTPRFDARGQSKAVAQSLEKYLHLVFSPRMQLYLVVGLLVLLWLNRQLDLKTIVWNWPVIIPTLAAIGGYLLVVTDLRYVAAYVVIVWLVLFSGVEFPAAGKAARLATAVIVALGVLSFYRPIYVVAVTRVPAYWKAAVALNNSGIKAGDKIAVIGPETFGMYVARLAKTQIIAEVREEMSRFCAEQPAIQARAIEALRRTGATAILASADSSARPSGWQKLGNTAYSVYRLANMKP